MLIIFLLVVILSSKKVDASKNLIKNIFSRGNWWVLNKPFAKKVGYCETILLMELIYQEECAENNQTINGDGFFPCTQEHIENNTGFPERTQRRYCKTLERYNLITTIRKGDRAQKWYKIHHEIIEKILKTLNTSNVPITTGHNGRSKTTAKMAERNRTKCPASYNNKEKDLNKKNTTTTKNTTVVVEDNEFVNKLAEDIGVEPIFFQEVIDLHQLESFTEVEKAIASLKNDPKTESIPGTLKNGSYCFYEGKCKLKSKAFSRDVKATDVKDAECEPGTHTQDQIHTDASWENVLKQLEARINRASYNTWIRPLILQNIQGNIWTIGVLDEVFIYWLREYYIDVIRDVVEKLSGARTEIEFQVIKSEE